MTDIREEGRKATAQVLDVVGQAQDAAVEAVQAWAEAVRRLTPDVPVPPGVAAATDKLPKPADLYDDVFDFAEKVLAGQREFTKRLLEAAGPAAPAPAAAKKAAATK